MSPLPSASDEPTSGNIQHTVPAEHNTGVVPGAAVIDVDGTMVADASGITVVDAAGAMVVDEDACPLLPSITSDQCRLSLGA